MLMRPLCSLPTPREDRIEQRAEFFKVATGNANASLATSGVDGQQTPPLMFALPHNQRLFVDTTTTPLTTIPVRRKACTERRAPNAWKTKRPKRLLGDGRYPVRLSCAHPLSSLCAGDQTGNIAPSGPYMLIMQRRGSWERASDSNAANKPYPLRPRLLP
uniref:Pyridoxamine 5'-phosphate oxidase n=1 Tax=Steinernema glaseri TaxID=37863 RepID=A0A1I7ZBF2_9BILA